MSQPKRIYLAIALLVVLALTRVGHFGGAINLPDATLAVFFFGGLWLAGLEYFGVCMALAFGIDVYLAQTTTEAGWCLTPAYFGLIPSYGAMWLAGRWLGRTPELPVVRFATVSLGAVAVAFLISNATFWAFSGYFGSMPAADYAWTVSKYFLPYLTNAVLYLTLGWVAQRLLLQQHRVRTA